ncbi:hypothetical protein [Novacetimonas hansenii]|uniref:hypothetical protein n=1 Tax=Novacetimonas hansenii TaxID=436 RepID=UPI00248E98F2|nr:hypothetical protein [Novacetimonas hansenii]
MAPSTLMVETAMNMYAVTMVVMAGVGTGIGLCRAGLCRAGLWRAWMTRELAALERGRPLDI